MGTRSSSVTVVQWRPGAKGLCALRMYTASLTKCLSTGWRRRRAARRQADEARDAREGIAEPRGGMGNTSWRGVALPTMRRQAHARLLPRSSTAEMSTRAASAILQKELNGMATGKRRNDRRATHYMRLFLNVISAEDAYSIYALFISGSSYTSTLRGRGAWPYLASPLRQPRDDAKRSRKLSSTSCGLTSLHCP